MEKKECLTFFEDWLRAYADHLHLVRQGLAADLLRPDVSKPPISEKTNEGKVIPMRKSTNA